MRNALEGNSVIASEAPPSKPPNLRDELTSSGSNVLFAAVKVHAGLQAAGHLRQRRLRSYWIGNWRVPSGALGSRAMELVLSCVYPTELAIACRWSWLVLTDVAFLCVSGKNSCTCLPAANRGKELLRLRASQRSEFMSALGIIIRYLTPVPPVH